MSANPSSRVVLITGCSSGIGESAAEVLAEAGHTVHATARRPESVERLAAWAAKHPGRAAAHRLDVNDQAAVQAVVESVLQREGRIDCLVNNAGYGQAGAAEDVTLEQWRAQFETNLMGTVAMTQAVLPAMRARGAGRIINVSSVVAHVSMPLMGAYCASKHALDAFSVALRMEVSEMGIRVVLIEPGPIATSFRSNVMKEMEAHPIHERSAYAHIYQAQDSYWEGQSGEKAASARSVAALIRRAVEARRPKLRYRITPIAHVVHWLLPWVPERVADRLILRRIGM